MSDQDDLAELDNPWSLPVVCCRSSREPVKFANMKSPVTSGAEKIDTTKKRLLKNSQKLSKENYSRPKFQTQPIRLKLSRLSPQIIMTK